jgi:hypothetical protein
MRQPRTVAFQASGASTESALPPDNDQADAGRSRVSPTGDLDQWVASIEATPEAAPPGANGRRGTGCLAFGQRDASIEPLSLDPTRKKLP